ncbi:hypothetical protein QWZ08_25070 [Ferruginibacter paludis]|uniref:hypothetical protein n=1 Tax=Ferruginibacter paludis TaxID=1310417 RepID=UPI0025B43E75|nr:hypothetical protein [Ferruginibacter paludis]MDN3658940.1 hypothetical protein [Ferruginibacter paludis]
MPALIDNYSSTAQFISAWPLSSVRGHTSEDNPTSAASLIIMYGEQYILNGTIMNLLNEFATLNDNWDDEGAKAPSIIAIEKAKAITSLLDKHGQKIFHTAPGPNGEVMIDIRSRNKAKSIEIIFYSNISIAVKFPEKGHAEQSAFTAGDLPDLLTWLNQKPLINA